MIALLSALLLQEPPPPAMHARYGPLTQCVNGYAATAGETEAIIAMEGGFTLMSDTDPFHIQIDRGDPYRSQKQATDVELANLGPAIRYQRRYSGSAPEIETSYVIPSRDDRPAILVNSTDFDGSEHDLRSLGRIVRIEGEQGCGNFQAPAYPGETPAARLWRPVSTPGPFFRCQNGVGFPVLQGEALQTAWRGFDERPAVRLSSPNPWSSNLDPIHLIVRGPKEPVSGAGAVARNYRQTLERMDNAPTLLLMPPHGGPDRYGQDERYRFWISIAYPPGQEAAARSFANRIEFVESTDPRCRAD